MCVDANNLKDLVVTTTLHENYASPADDRHMMAVYELQRCLNELNTYNTVTPMIRTAKLMLTRAEITARFTATMSCAHHMNGT